ncbi:MAG: O-antigen ligase family protein [Huintestinicola sp.]
MKISKSLLLCLFLIIPFIKPAEYVFNSLFDNMMDVWKIFSSLTAILMYIKRSRVSPIIIATVLYQLSILFPTVLNDSADLRQQMVVMLSNIAFAVIVELGIRNYRNDFLKAMSIYGGVMCLIMAVTMYIYYPNGMDQKEFMDILGDKNYYFLGHDNGSFFVVFAAQFFSVINCIEKKGKLTFGTVVFWLFVDGAFIYVRSGAAVAAIFLMWFYIFLLYKKDIAFLNFRNYILAVLILFFSVVVFRLHVYFPFIVENVFHKNMTLSGRTLLWNRAMAYIKLSPFIGYGQEETYVLIDKLGIGHVHNIILEILYKSGIVGLTLYSVIIGLVGKKLMDHRYSRINDLTAFCLFIFFIISMVDYYESKYFMYGVIIFAYNMPYIVGTDKEKAGEMVQ